ncbi:MAG TPA: hypothetical protein VGU25_01860 [Acidobacteriaceae bacterium]|nr:hypothetical protein [Acidobacteriaceae bacterium]
MADYSPRAEGAAEPRGFGEHTRGLSGEYAHEQGWGLNIEQRRRESVNPQNTDGGLDYNYGARVFGDEPVNTQLDPNAAGQQQNTRKD